MAFDTPHIPDPVIKLHEIGVVSTKTKQERYRTSIYRAMGRDDPESSCSSFESDRSSAFGSSHRSGSFRELSSLEIIVEVDEGHEAQGDEAALGDEDERCDFTERYDNESVRLHDNQDLKAEDEILLGLNKLQSLKSHVMSRKSSNFSVAKPREV